MSVIVYQFEIVKFIQMMSLTFGLFTQVSGSGPLGPLVWNSVDRQFCTHCIIFLHRTPSKVREFSNNSIGPESSVSGEK